jgi:hypothetical protein
MPTKESIVQRLLDEKLITAKEAVVLLKTENTKWLPNPQPQPWIGPGTTLPYQPYTTPPNTPYNPMYPQCDWTVRSGSLPYYGTIQHAGTADPNSFAHTTNENFCVK